MFKKLFGKKETRSSLESFVDICKKENKDFEADPMKELLKKQKELMELTTKFELA